MVFCCVVCTGSLVEGRGTGCCVVCTGSLFEGGVQVAV